MNRGWVGQNNLPTSNHGNSTDNGTPSGVDTRDIFVLRPNFRHLCRISVREGIVEGAVNRDKCLMARIHNGPFIGSFKL